MPTYDFACTACKHTFEKMNSISKRNDPLMYPCPKCGALKVERRISSPSEVVPDAYRIGRVPKDTGMQEVFAKIHENTPGSNLNEKLSRNPSRFQ